MMDIKAGVVFNFIVICMQKAAGLHQYLLLCAADVQATRRSLLLSIKRRSLNLSGCVLEDQIQQMLHYLSDCTPSDLGNDV